ncbi:hypothetical protein [Maritalea sp.]|jgi:hypothetical protein|uniref:hypothetical protein n=1 Tax=Maritalea sp. TaxID=2003361 RepID=UPI0039E504B8
MSRVIQVYIDDSTELRLLKASEQSERTIEDLAECAVCEYVMNAFRNHKDDPGAKA